MINHSRVRISFWLSAVICFTAIVLLLILLDINKIIVIKSHAFGLTFDLLCIFLTISIVVIFVFYYLVRKKFDFFEFPVWFTLNVYFQVIVNIWLFQRNYHFYSPWLVSQPEKYANQTVLLIWGGLVIIWFVYFFGIRGNSKYTKPQIVNQLKPRLKVMFVIWFITWLISLFSTISGAQGYLSANTSFIGENYLLLISLINNLATFNLMIYYFKTPTKWGKVWIVFVCSVSLLEGLIIGTKSAIFIFLYLIMCYFYSRGQLPKKWLVVCVIAVFLVVPIVNTFRSNLFSSGYNRSSGASLVDRLPILQNSIAETFNQPLIDIFVQTRDTFEVRQGSIFEVTAAFLAVHPKFQPFVFKDLMDSIAITIIPRFIWVDKPTTRPNIYNISTNYLGAINESSFAASGQIADAYRIGGVLFLFTWLGFITWLISKSYKAGPGKGSISGTAFYLLLISGIITYDNDVFSTIMRLLQFGIILFFINNYLFFYRKEQTQSRE